MAEPIASTYVEIKYDQVTKAQQAIDRMGANFGQQARTIETHAQRVSKAFTAIGTAVGTIGMARLAGDIVTASAKFDTLDRMMVRIEGSTGAANKRIAEFRQLAKLPILDLGNLSKYYVQLKSVQVEQKLAIDFQKNLANEMSGIGGSNQAYAGFMEQITQMAGKGKLMGDELRILSSWLPTLRRDLQEAFGTSIPEEITKKGFTAIDIIEKLNAQWEKSPRFAGGAQASIDNFKQSLELFEASLGKTVLPTFTKLLDFLTNLMDQADKMPNALKTGLAVFAMGSPVLLGMASMVEMTKFLTGASGLMALAKTGAASSAITAGSSMVATGVLNAQGNMIMREAGAAGAGAVAGSSLLTKAGIVTVFIAGATGAFWAGSKLGSALFGKDYDSKGNIITKEKPLTDAEMSKWQASVDKFNASYFGISDTGAKATGKTIPASESIMAKIGDADIEELQKLGMNIPTQADREKTAKEAKKKADQWVEFWNDINSIAYPPKFKADILSRPGPNAMSIMDLYPAIGARSTGQAEYTPGIKFSSMIKMAENANIDRGIGKEGLGISGVGTGFNASDFIQHSEKQIRIELEQTAKEREKFFDKWQDDFKQTAKETGKVQDSWNDLMDNIENRIEKIADKDRKLSDLGAGIADNMLSRLPLIGNLIDTNLTLEQRKNQESISAANTLISLAQGLVSILDKRQAFKESEMQLENQVRRGELDPNIAFLLQLEKSSLGAPHNLAVRLLHEKGVPGYAEGGWATQPQLAMVAEREPELIIPKSKLGQAGIGGITIQNVNIYFTHPNVNKQAVLTIFNELRREGNI